MGSSVVEAPSARHRLIDELPSPRMAKASSRKLNSDFQAQIGQAIGRARLLVGWSKKELAGAVEMDEAQISRWEGGKERPQFDRLWAVEQMRKPLVVALAELARVKTATTITIEWTA